MNRILKLLVLTVILFITAGPVFAFEEMNRRIGIIYLKNAAAYYLNGDYEASEGFLEKASEFHSSSSDYEYIKGLIRLERDNDLNGAAESFNNAVSFDNWMLLERKDCISDLAQLMFRRKQYPALVKIVEEKAYPDFNDNDLMYLYLLSLKYDGQHAKYADVLSLSIIRYPDDYRFGMLYIGENNRYRDSVIEGRVKYSSSEGALRAFLKAAISLDDGKSEISALQEYFRRGGNDLSARLEYYRLTGSPDEQEIDRLFELGLMETPSYRMRLLSILPYNELRRKVENAYAEYTGNIYYDHNGDEYFEELHLYDGGKPAGISIDENQDGVIEVMIIFEKGLPIEIILTGEDFIRISYDSYPYLREMSISGSGEINVYTFLKEKLTLPVYRIRETDGKIEYDSIKAEAFISDQDSIRRDSVRISTYAEGKGLDRWGELKKELERQDENFSILKVYNSLLGNYIYRQSNNKRIAGFGDVDFDNIIDLKEIYSDGKLVSIEADENKNGKYDFKMSFDEESIVSWWDFNEDGVYDCRQYRVNGVLINEYSSRFDGVFDIIERN